MENETIARAMFDAFQAGDIAAAGELLADDFAGVQNGGPAMPRDALLGFLATVHAKVSDFRYEDIVCEATATGFVEEHTVRATLTDGSPFAMKLCVVGTVANGKVTQLREYLDTAQAAGLAAALAA
ncbi:MAG: nuclear transport factor 2 family protein [Pseudomonadota bacterium]|nr:nuclear transport factor 2 family protein [Pseudomonadota bacterium]